MSLNAAPKAILNGIQDVSGRRADPEQLALPIHLPHVMILAQRGPVDALPLSSSDAQRIYGDETFNYRSKYAKHTTALAKECFFPAANLVMFQRVLGEGAARSAIGFGLDLIEKQLTVYERNVDGSFKLDAQGAKIDTGQKVVGLVGKWVTYPVKADEIGKTSIKVGTMSDGGTQSQLYPMFEASVSHFGSYGDNVGIRLWSPTTEDNSPLNDTIVAETNAYLYRIAFLERASAKSTPVLQKGLVDQTYVDFGLKPGMYYEATSTSYDADKVIIPSYRNIDRSSGYAPEYGPFEKFKIYHDNVKAVSELVFAKEQTFQGWTADDLYMVNLIGGHDINGNPYHTFELLDVFAGGLPLNEQATHYAVGGADGDTSDAAFDEACYTEFQNYGSLNNEFLDIARFPQSVVYDSGFTMKTKKAMMKVIGSRKDIWGCWSTQDVSLAQNDATTESSMAVALRSALEMFPEATLFGTSVVRGAVIGQSGYLINSEYDKLVPATFEIAYNMALWAGSGDGRLKGRYSPDVEPNNRVKLLRDVNSPWKSERVRNKDWDNGLVWFQSYDWLSLFCPAMQTVFKDDTSILNSLLNMVICVEVEKVCFRTWRSLTGRSNMTNAQYEEASNELILENTKGRFDERVVIVPETYHSARDVKLGFKSSAKVHVYAPNMKSVAEFDVVGHRMEELSQ